MTAGSLNRRITIQRPSTETDDYGQPTTAWKTVACTWASIHAATGKEVFKYGFVSELSHVITIRFSPFVQSNMRVLYRGRVFNIQAVSDPDEGRVQLDLLCVEVST